VRIDAFRKIRYEESRENVDKVAKNYALAIELVRRNYNGKIAELEG